MRKFLPFCALALLFSTTSNSQATTSYTDCPDVNIAIVRAGTNASTTNPYYLYNVATTTGVMTLVPGGPFKDPADASKFLQVNAIGVSKKDGFIYGLTNDPTVTSTRFLRLDRNYQVTSLGSIVPPSSPTGQFAFINSAAGETDTAGNYYFTAATFNTTSSGAVLDKLFLGRIANIQTLTGAGNPVPQYFEIDVSHSECSNYINSFMTDPNNSGLKDFSYNAFTNTFFSYATYANGSGGFNGKLIELRPVPGSSPLKYELVCSIPTNTHSAELSGTLIDKLGRFGVLFTNGSYGLLNKDAATGAYNGTITMVANNGTTGLPNPLRGDMASCGQHSSPPPPSVSVATCPIANFIVARAGMNADAFKNPHFIYQVNGMTGQVTQIGGPGLLDPLDPTRPLEVNGVGLNIADGYFYGLAYEGTVNTGEFVRFDQAYGVKRLGDIAPPTSPTGVLGIVNFAAGDVDRSNNYYFSAFTANPTLDPSMPFTLDKLFIGKISNIAGLTGAANPVPQYFEIDYSDANCSQYISTFTSDPNNSGLKDFVYNAFTNTFITYVTYKPTGFAGYRGQVVELKPITGSSPLRYKMFCSPVVNTHTAEVSGTLIDNAGNFLVLMTDGTIGKIGSPVSYQYDGTYIALNNNTGLPNPLRGDMASCSGPTAAPLPVRLGAFTVNSKDCSNTFTWTAENEVDFNRYELEQSTDNVTYSASSTVAARRSLTSTTYKVTLPSTGRTTYCRLKMIDNNGNFTYSRTLTVAANCTGKTGFVVNPNPVNRQLNLNWFGVNNNTRVDILILNANGSVVSRILRIVPAGTSSLNIDVSSLINGAYWIKAIDAEGNSSYESKFIKQ